MTPLLGVLNDDNAAPNSSKKILGRGSKVAVVDHSDDGKGFLVLTVIDQWGGMREIFSLDVIILGSLPPDWSLDDLLK